MYFRVSAALFDHTVQGALSPPHTSRRWDWQFRDKLKTKIRELHWATLRTRGSFGKPLQEGVPGLQRGPKAKLPRPTFNFPRRLSPPNHDSADRRLRPGDANCSAKNDYHLVGPSATKQGCIISNFRQKILWQPHTNEDTFCITKNLSDALIYTSL